MDSSLPVEVVEGVLALQRDGKRGAVGGFAHDAPEEDGGYCGDF